MKEGSRQSVHNAMTRYNLEDKGNVIFKEEHMNRHHAQRVLFEQIKRTVPIEAVLAKYGIELKRKGNSSKGRCPIHKGSNSRQFVVSNNLWQVLLALLRTRRRQLELVAELERST